MSSDAFWKISLCKVYEKSSGCIFTIYVFENEAVCREVQTHFGCSGAISRFMCPKSKRFAHCWMLLAVCLGALQVFILTEMFFEVFGHSSMISAYNERLIKFCSGAFL